MAASNTAKKRDDGAPVRSTGRTFASIDPERVREVVPGEPARGSAQPGGQPPANDAGRAAGGAVPVRPANDAGHADGDEGGSRRR
jgi:hypothetical protein